MGSILAFLRRIQMDTVWSNIQAGNAILNFIWRSARGACLDYRAGVAGVARLDAGSESGVLGSGCGVVSCLFFLGQPAKGSMMANKIQNFFIEGSPVTRLVAVLVRSECSILIKRG